VKSLERIVEDFPKLLKLFANQLQIVWQKSLSEQFKDKDNELFNNSTKLRSSRGGKSLKADLSKNAKVVINDGKVELKFDTDKPYAGIQDRGGFIKATPVQRRLKSGATQNTYKMAQYFWAKSFEAETSRLKKFYTIMALSVNKRGGVKIKGKHYLENSLKNLEDKYLQNVLNQFFEQVLRVWNAN